MAIEGLEELCTCPVDTQTQALVKVVNNFNKIFLAMAEDYEGQVVSLIGRDGCGCTPAQIMEAFNANLIEFGRVYTGGGAGTPGGADGDLQFNEAGAFGGIAPGADGEVLAVVGGAWQSTAAGSGAVDSVNAQTGVVVLDATDVGAASLTADSDVTGQYTFTKSPEIDWTPMTTGTGKTPAIDTQYYIAAFTANTTVDSYVGTPANGTRIAYNLKACDGTAVFTFPPAQRSGDVAGTSTQVTPTPGEHMIVFTYINGGWVYQDDVVLSGVATSGTFAAPITTAPLTLLAYEAYDKVLHYGATGTINLPAGVAGMNLLIYNTGAFTITIDPNGSEAIVRDGTLQTGGVSIVLASGAGNFVALENNGTEWVTLGATTGAVSQGS